MIPVNHGKHGAGQYESSAFFIRHDPTRTEFLFFGDVEPDVIASTPKNINIWRIAAPKIPTTLSTIFIECSWPSGRPDDLLYGHLSPEHLVAELEVLATELVKIRTKNNIENGYIAARRDSQAGTDNEPDDVDLRPARKKQKTSAATTPAESESLTGALTGLRVYVMHCKDTMTCDLPVNRLIVEQVRALVARKGLGADILAAEQGMRIGAS
jgi:cAMP phosphodiesterase